MSSFFPLSPPAHSFFIGPIVINILDTHSEVTCSGLSCRTVVRVCLIHTCNVLLYLLVLSCTLPFPHSQSHMPALVMHCCSLFAPFLACVVPSFYSIFYCILCSVPCLRLCLRKVAQVSLSAAELPSPLISSVHPYFRPNACLVFSFALS